MLLQSIAVRVFGGRDTLHAPHLLDIEVTQVLRRYVALVTRDERLAAAPRTAAAIEVL